MLQYGTLCPDRETGGAERLRARERLVDNAQAGSRPPPGCGIGVASGRRSIHLRRVDSSEVVSIKSDAWASSEARAIRGITLGPIPQAADHAFWLWSFLTSASARSAAGRVTSGAQ